MAVSVLMANHIPPRKPAAVARRERGMPMSNTRLAVQVGFRLRQTLAALPWFVEVICAHVSRSNGRPWDPKSLQLETGRNARACGSTAQYAAHSQRAAFASRSRTA